MHRVFTTLESYISILREKASEQGLDFLGFDQVAPVWWHEVTGQEAERSAAALKGLIDSGHPAVTRTEEADGVVITRYGFRDQSALKLAYDLALLEESSRYLDPEDWVVRITHDGALELGGGLETAALTGPCSDMFALVGSRAEIEELCLEAGRRRRQERAIDKLQRMAALLS
jgi:hypothetical protein